MSIIRIWLDGEKQPPTTTTVFSGGEVHVNVSAYPHNCHTIFIKARISDSEGLIETLLLCEALSAKYPLAAKSCFIPYLPYARQDRRCTDGDAFSSMIIGRTILKGIADLGFSISSVDIHSGVAKSVFETQIGTTINEFELNTLPFFYSDTFRSSILVSPDGGAKEKVSTLNSKLGNTKGIISGYKLRNPRNGDLSGFGVELDEYDFRDDNLNGADVMIVDDICDGGGTFLGIAEKLVEKGCGKISLYVTHGIFSKGFEIFSGVISNIYTTDSFCREVSGEVAKDVQLKVFKL